MPVSGLGNQGDMTTIGVGSGSYLSGVFENGIPFVLGGEAYNLPTSVNLVQTAAYAPGQPPSTSRQTPPRKASITARP